MVTRRQKLLLFGGDLTLPQYTTLSLYVVGIGDSITQGIGASDAAHRWLNLVAASINAYGSAAAIVNGGGGGDYSNLVLNRIALTERRGVICLLPVINDARVAGQGVTENFINNLHALINFYEPIAQIIVVGSFPYILDYGTGSQADYLAQLAVIPSIVWSHSNVLYAPVYEYMGQNAALVDVDNVHPNDAGHQVIANAFWSAIKRFFVGSTVYPGRHKQFFPAYPLGNCEMDTGLTANYDIYACAAALDATQHLPDTRKSARVTVDVAEAFGTFYTMYSGTGVHPPWGPNAITHCQIWVKADATTTPVTVKVQTIQYDVTNTIIAGTVLYSGDYVVTSASWTLMEVDITTDPACRELMMGAFVSGALNIVYVGRMKAYAISPVVWTV